ncbi:hypothetical protein CANARDRAFT_27689 [[Candida] arabinofermentans NRRL YB-2248]|uniref:NADH dehydrogenase [ubiquinone] 1 beta subcomplex subunit 8, mitochondrial n=1 Tax=[Candida] arabinofermentans NRRL YB-2248 TaxID=983967 RepID=A0A1E4T402_9ASCO|nr:hypothetical protein CANARDRAFT_27689 [[Candida] arabinofermentans NRRL YB-2248]
MMKFQSHLRLIGLQNLKSSTKLITNGRPLISKRLSSSSHEPVSDAKASSPPQESPYADFVPDFMPTTGEFPDYKIPKGYIMPQKRDPYAKYFDQQNRRNFGEPMHPYQDMIDIWAPDYIDFVDDKIALKHFTLFFAGLLSFAGLIYALDLWPERPNMPRSYPYEGLYRDLGGREGEQELYSARIDKGL